MTIQPGGHTPPKVRLNEVFTERKGMKYGEQQYTIEQDR